MSKTPKELFLSPLILFVSFLMGVILSISLGPLLPNNDVVRATFVPGVVSILPNTTQARFGLWTACAADFNEHVEACLDRHIAYNVQFSSGMDSSGVAIIERSYTRGLFVHVFVMLTSLCSSIFMFPFNPALLRCGFWLTCVNFLGAIAAFAIDLVLLARVGSQMKHLEGHTAFVHPSWGFWWSLAVFVFSFCAVGTSMGSDKILQIARASKVQTLDPSTRSRKKSFWLPKLKRDKPTLSDPFAVEESEKRISSNN
ncbi:hypothetical protein DL96DRAFT_817163 [Flagelloscypha sp. PMI_526]|nr:hypothetical protein DL96DRAFT_817163 [Flagelloscypha sp. PMI_526]